MSISLQEVLDHLKKDNIRITETRKAIIHYLMNSKDHPSAEMIYHDLLPTFPNMSLATVYNNLKLLMDAGFITELKRKNDTTVYYDFMGHDHVNLICQQCGTISDLEIDQPSLIELVEKETGYHIQKEVLTLYGLCPNCQK
jgi:Fur family peroxide stress response transcriptional regulator